MIQSVPEDLRTRSAYVSGKEKTHSLAQTDSEFTFPPLFKLYSGPQGIQTHIVGASFFTPSTDSNTNLFWKPPH